MKRLWTPCAAAVLLVLVGCASGERSQGNPAGDAGSVSNRDGGSSFAGTTGAGAAGKTGSAGNVGAAGANGFAGSSGTAPLDAGASADAGSRPDAPPPPGQDAAMPQCQAKIESLVDPLASLPFGVGTQVKLRATALPIGAASTWSWSVVINLPGSPAPTPINVEVTPETPDASEVHAELRFKGDYVISARSGLCASAVMGRTQAPTDRRAALWVRVIPPAGSGLLPAHTPVSVGKDPTFAGAIPRARESRTILLESPIAVQLQPFDATTTTPVPAYFFRLRGLQSLLLLEGFVDGSQPFSAGLAPSGRDYDLQIVPTDDSLLTPAWPPFSLQAQTFDQLRDGVIGLSRGVRLMGTATHAGAGLSDVRITLSSAGLRSTVGRSGAGGAFDVRAPKGDFGVDIAPPENAGLPAARVPGGLPVTATSTRLDVAYESITSAPLRVDITDADGAATAALVRLETPTDGGARKVASVSLDGAAAVAAFANARFEREAAAGRADFASVPNGDYTLTVIPTRASAAAAITTTRVSTTGAPVAVPLKRRGVATGQLQAASQSLTFDGLQIVATDLLLAETVRAAVGADGRYTIDVSPGRSYRLYVERPAGRHDPRLPLPSLNNAGPTNTVVTRTLSQMSFSGRIGVGAGTGAVEGAVVQVFCADPDTVGCVDPDRPRPDDASPLDETVTTADGAFQVTVLDPTAPR